MNDPALPSCACAQNSFLAAAKAAAVARQPCRVVIGNEASDLDSIASSIAYARLLQAQTPPGGAAVVPVLNIPREDLPLRTEAPHPPPPSTSAPRPANPRKPRRGLTSPHPTPTREALPLPPPTHGRPTPAGAVAALGPGHRRGGAHVPR